MRYTINIFFKTKMFERSEDICEGCKTLREARSYESMIDETVRKAYIEDTVKNEKIWLKE